MADAQHGEVSSTVGVADIGLRDARFREADEFIAPLIITRCGDARHECHACTWLDGGADGEPETQGLAY